MKNVNVHESVLVGYFCQAVGWISRDLADKDQSTLPLSERYMRAINLSHNPLDPAIGDMILQFDDAQKLPKEFYIFEFKVNWDKGVRDEHTKFAEKHGGKALTPEFVSEVIQKFPEAKHAHLYGALAENGENRHALCAVPYWEAMLSASKAVLSVFLTLANIVHNQAAQGFSLERLASYMEHLNSEAKAGSMAANGSARFAVAYADYQLYSFNLDSIVEYQLDKQRRLEHPSDYEADPDNDRGFSP